jgi:hypothetical protein
LAFELGYHKRRSWGKARGLTNERAGGGGAATGAGAGAGVGPDSPSAC